MAHSTHLHKNENATLIRNMIHYKQTSIGDRLLWRQTPCTIWDRLLWPQTPWAIGNRSLWPQTPWAIENRSFWSQRIFAIGARSRWQQTSCSIEARSHSFKNDFLPSMWLLSIWKFHAHRHTHVLTLDGVSRIAILLKYTFNIYMTNKLLRARTMCKSLPFSFVFHHSTDSLP